VCQVSLFLDSKKLAFRFLEVIFIPHLVHTITSLAIPIPVVSALRSDVRCCYSQRPPLPTILMHPGSAARWRSSSSHWALLVASRSTKDTPTPPAFFFLSHEAHHRGQPPPATVWAHRHHPRTAWPRASSPTCPLPSCASTPACHRLPSLIEPHPHGASSPLRLLLPATPKWVNLNTGFLLSQCPIFLDHRSLDWCNALIFVKE
jgi:hypothetical protein